jgi:hypothetical protein
MASVCILNNLSGHGQPTVTRLYPPTHTPRVCSVHNVHDVRHVRDVHDAHDVDDLHDVHDVQIQGALHETQPIKWAGEEWVFKRTLSTNPDGQSRSNEKSCEFVNRVAHPL